MHKMCSSDESKCAVMKGCLCSDKKGHSEIWLDNKNFFCKRSFRNWSPAFAIEMCSAQFSLKHALGSGSRHRLALSRPHSQQQSAAVADIGQKATVTSSRLTR